MKVAFLQDMDFHIHKGGAELSDSFVFNEGLRRGYDMRLVLPESFSKTIVDQSDMFIISNATRFRKEDLLYIAQNKPCVMYLHDYFPLCNYRLYFPMISKCTKCKNKPFAEALLTKSILNVFLSPLHLKAFSSIIPSIRDHPYHLHPSTIDVDLFRPNNGIKRLENTALAVNPFTFKGLENLIAYKKENPDIEYHWLGHSDQPDKLEKSGWKHLPRVLHEDMPKLYSTYQYYVHLPNSPQPFERTICEAYMCGCSLIVTPLIGAMSYDWFVSREEVRKHVKDPHKQFWEAVEKHV